LGRGFKLIENSKVIGWHSSGKSITSDGKHNIYVPYAIPEEIINIEVIKHQKNKYISGQIHQIVQPSSYRVNPVCQHFQQCGGCDWMHIQYQQQLEYKKSLIDQALKKYNIPYPEIKKVIPSPKQLYYRGKLDFSCAIDDNGYPFLGFHPMDKSSSIFPIENCFIADTKSIETAKNIEKLLIRNKIPVFSAKNQLGLKGLSIRQNKAGKQMVTFQISSYNEELINQLTALIPQSSNYISSVYCSAPIGSSEKVSESFSTFLLIGESSIYENVNNLNFRISNNSFYQPNIFLADKLFNLITEIAAPTKNDIVYDLYSGIGTIALHIAPFANYVIGIEGSLCAIDDANFNSQLNHQQNISFYHGDVLKTFTPEFVKHNHKPSIIILDPPRSGTLIETLKNMLLTEPEKIIYVSCNPVSLAWNLSWLISKYRIAQIQPLDMFPQTHHVETIVLLERI
jgi:23S rRNA (uracil1939-C5)-methyltransferase